MYVADAAAAAAACSTNDRFLEFSFRGAIPLSLSSFSLCTEVSELLQAYASSELAFFVFFFFFFFFVFFFFVVVFFVVFFFFFFFFFFFSFFFLLPSSFLRAGFEFTFGFVPSLSEQRCPSAVTGAVRNVPAAPRARSHKCCPWSNGRRADESRVRSLHAGDGALLARRGHVPRGMYDNAHTPHHTTPHHTRSISITIRHLSHASHTQSERAEGSPCHTRESQ